MLIATTAGPAIQPVSGSVTLTIPNFAALPHAVNQLIWTTPFTVAGLRWQAKLYPGGQVDVQSDWSGQLAIYICPVWDSSEKNGRRAAWTFTILNHANRSRDRTLFDSKQWPRNNATNRGTALIDRSRLLDPAKGYVTADGTVQIRIDICLFPRALPTSEAAPPSAGDTELLKLSADLKQAFQSGWRSDATLKCGGTDIKAHRLILAARSPVFKAMFEHEMQEEAQGIVEIDEIEPSVMRDLVAFLYTGECSLDPESSSSSSSSSSAASGDLEEEAGAGGLSVEEKKSAAASPASALTSHGDRACKLFAAAHRFQVASLIETTEKYLGKTLTIDNVVERLLLADRFCAAELKVGGYSSPASLHRALSPVHLCS